MAGRLTYGSQAKAKRQDFYYTQNCVIDVFPEPCELCVQGKRYGSGSVDEQVMGRLGEVIQGMKDDFIVVHLQEPCSLCREYISDAAR